MNEVATTEAQHSEAMQLSSAQVTEQVQLIQQVLRSVMKQDEHYGIIPGTQKPTLLKAGAEKLCLTFRLSPSYVVERIDHPNGHREYIITARLTHIPTGRIWGEGVGSCSTLEKKYRYRNEYKPTGRKVPRDYWDGRNPDIIGGKGFVAKKDDAGVWMIYEAGGQSENADIAEAYNTVLKMAKKRALTDATLNACAASDIFTQDLDEQIEDAPKPESGTKNANLASAQAEFEREKGITREVKENLPSSPRPELKTLDDIPADIKQYFKARLLRVGEIKKIYQENNYSDDKVREYIKNNPLPESKPENLAEHLKDERVPESV